MISVRATSRCLSPRKYLESHGPLVGWVCALGKCVGPMSLVGREASLMAGSVSSVMMVPWTGGRMVERMTASRAASGRQVREGRREQAGPAHVSPGSWEDESRMRTPYGVGCKLTFLHEVETPHQRFQGLEDHSASQEGYLGWIPLSRRGSPRVPLKARLAARGRRGGSCRLTRRLTRRGSHCIFTASVDRCSFVPGTVDIKDRPLVSAS